MKINLVILLGLVTTSLSAQQPSKVAGTWEGKINVGVPLRIVFHIKDSLGFLSGTTDSPDQGIKGIRCSNVMLRNDSLLLDVPEFKGKYAGKLTTDTSIAGKLIQGIGIDLTLVKVKRASVIVRSQTPKPPYNYISEDVKYYNGDKTIQYGATITIPKGKGPFPAVLLVSGSGAQNRDGEVFEHKPFTVIADYLTSRGYVVLRVDDRGVGETTGNISTATTEDFAGDANTSLEYLKQRKEVNNKQLGIIGHSEGGMIAPMLASKRKDISFIVLLAAPGEKIAKLMEDQNKAVLLSRGYTKAAAEAYGNLYRDMIPVINNAQNIEVAESRLNTVVNAWKAVTPKGIVMGTTGITSDSTQNVFVHALASSLTTPWYKYFLQFDPQPNLSNLSCRVLALNGDKDLQVLSAPNLAAIKKALEKSKSPGYEVKEIQGLNHLFQSCKKCTLSEYAQLDESFSQEALKIMDDWLKENVK